MFNDDGLGQAMALDSAQRSGDEAKKQVYELQRRVKALEKAVAKLTAYVFPNQEDSV
ncbi:hypothetical protein [Mesorhizobium sp.]|uniref:hypothetical protein n=1 Tax=Mesorhizobium sp. TaxID=1871066 RepID=UPI00257E298D|nr:hypothetical protein [Mesorhizobium sp.]